MFWLRGAMILTGAFLFLLGVGKTYWEVKSWEVLSTIGERPAVYEGDNPRVHFRIFIFVAALGILIFVGGLVPWE